MYEDNLIRGPLSDFFAKVYLHIHLCYFRSDAQPQFICERFLFFPEELLSSVDAGSYGYRGSFTQSAETGMDQIYQPNLVRVYDIQIRIALLMDNVRI